MYIIGESIQDRFEISAVHCGGMGMVYICYDTLQKEFVVLNTLQDRLLLTFRSMERFVREAHTWIRLGQHPNIVRAYEVKQINGLPYILMEYIPGDTDLGSTLRGWILQKRVDFFFAIDIILQLCHGLQYAQNIIPGIVHRDIKPENVLITPDRMVKLSDFGLATAIIEDHDFLDQLPKDEYQDSFHPTLTRTGRTVGTPPYMSPEQCAGSQIDYRSDIYSIGCMFYELLTEQWLMDSHTPSDWLTWHLRGTPRPPSRIKRELASLDHIILQCLEKNPKNRYQTFSELSRDLKAIYRQLTGAPYSYNKLEDILPTSRPDERMERVRSFILLGQKTHALSELEGILTTTPDSLEALIRKAQVLVQQDRDNEASICLDKILQLHPSSKRAKVNKAIIYIKASQLEQAISLLQEVVDSAPSPQTLTAAWVNLGVVNAMSGKNEAADKCYDAALRIEPWSREAWLNKAYLYRAEGRSDVTAWCYRQALLYSVSLENRSALALELVKDLETLGDLDEAVFEMAIRAIQRMPPQIATHRSSSRTGDSAITAELFGGSISDNIPDMRTYLVVCEKIQVLAANVIYAEFKGEQSRSRKVLDEIYKLILDWLEANRPNTLGESRVNKSVAFLYILVALDLATASQNDIALEVLRRVEDLGVEAGTARGLQAHCLYEMNREDDALIYAEKALRLAPKAELEGSFWTNVRDIHNILLAKERHRNGKTDMIK